MIYFIMPVFEFKLAQYFTEMQKNAGKELSYLQIEFN